MSSSGGRPFVNSLTWQRRVLKSPPASVMLPRMAALMRFVPKISPACAASDTPSV